GDEVTVPGWTDADDHALAEGLVDMMCSKHHFQHRAGERWIVPNDFARLLNTWDPEVRIGTCEPARMLRYEDNPNPEQLVQAATAVQKMLKDPDPVVRAAGIHAFTRWAYAGSRQPAKQQEQQAAQVLKAAVEDPAPECRFAAVSTAYSRRDPDGALLDRLLNDPSAAVRAGAWYVWIGRYASSHRTLWLYGEGVPWLDEFRKGPFAEKNPIARCLSVFTCVRRQRDADKVKQLLNVPEVQKDPWLKTVADLFYTGFFATRSARRDAVADVPTLADACTMVTKLMASGKRSHRVLACGTMLAGFDGVVKSLGRAKPEYPKGQRPDFSALAALADSKDIWTRFFGIVANGPIGGDEADARILKAMKSRDDLDRLAGLLACCIPKWFVDGTDEAPAPGKHAAALKEALLAALRCPRYAESTLAAQAIMVRMPFDEALALFQHEAKRDPLGRRTKTLLVAFNWFTAPSRGSDQLRVQRQMMVLDAVLETKDPVLQLWFADGMGWWFMGRNEALVLTMICESAPEAFFELVSAGTHSQRRFYSFSSENFAVQAILGRLKSLHEAGGPLAAKAVRALAGLIRKVNSSDSPERDFLPLAETMLANMLKPDSPAEHLAAGGELLDALANSRPAEHLIGDAMRKRRRQIDGILAAASRALDYADQPALTRNVAALLGTYYRLVNLKKNPELAEVMERARRKIMQAGRPCDQVLLLSGMAQNSGFTIRELRGDGTRRPASAELQKRFLADTIPADLRLAALRAIRPMEDDLTRKRPYVIDLSPEFQKYLLQRIKDPKEAADFRRQAAIKLAWSPQYIGEVIAALQDAARAEPPALDMPAILGDIRSPVEAGLRRAKKNGEPAPAWQGQAAALGLMVMNDDRQPDGRLWGATHLYGLAGGARATAALEALALDENASDNLRAAAAEAAWQTNPETKVFVKLTEKYATIEKELRLRFGAHAAQARNIPGAEAYVIRCFKDPQLKLPDKPRHLYDDEDRRRLSDILSNLHLP
ncbi:MAG: HEAT repeat domain-containing protein, partial [Planctomycetes bacterium]|nr:HEAT repeat domain-containing protein [Planctomycetota bacterium]